MGVLDYLKSKVENVVDFIEKKPVTAVTTLLASPMTSVLNPIVIGSSKKRQEIFADVESVVSSIGGLVAGGIFGGLAGATAGGGAGATLAGVMQAEKNYPTETLIVEKKVVSGAKSILNFAGEHPVGSAMALASLPLVVLGGKGIFNKTASAFTGAKFADWLSIGKEEDNTEILKDVNDKVNTLVSNPETPKVPLSTVPSGLPTNPVPTMNTTPNSIPEVVPSSTYGGVSSSGRRHKRSTARPSIVINNTQRMTLNQSTRYKKSNLVIITR